MFETPLTVVGNIVNHPIRHRVGDQEVMRFRVASNSRRRTTDGTWEAGNSLFVGVSCWGKLATGVGASLGKGDAVIVVGNVYTSEYEDRDGVSRSSAEIRATSVGPDLSRCVARVEKLRPSAGADNTATVPGVGATPAGPDGDDLPDEDVDADAAKALPLTA
jgi:single-strand DNA-binding protein